MIQASRDNNQASTTNSIYADLYDTMTSLSYKPLIAFKSQLTNKTKHFIATTMTTTKKDRYIKLDYHILKDDGETLTGGVIYMGTQEFPYGFYDVTIYQNNNNTNLDPANAIKVIYKTIMNFKSVNNDAITYSEYNETITQPTYITNTI
jgi:hypothetical protein